MVGGNLHNYTLVEKISFMAEAKQSLEKSSNFFDCQTFLPEWRCGKLCRHDGEMFIQIQSP